MGRVTIMSANLSRKKNMDMEQQGLPFNQKLQTNIIKFHKKITNRQD